MRSEWKAISFGSDFGRAAAYACDTEVRGRTSTLNEKEVIPRLSRGGSESLTLRWGPGRAPGSWAGASEKRAWIFGVHGLNEAPA